MMRVVFVLWVVLGFGCSGQRAQQVPLGAEAQALWDRCATNIEHYCHEHSHGDPSHDTECMNQERTNLGAQADDAARRRYLAAHGCSL